MIVRAKTMLIGAVAAFCLAFFAGPASAAVTTYLTQSNFLPDGGNYGTVLFENSSDAGSGLAAGSVRFTLNINPLRVGDEFGSFAFNTDLNLTAAGIAITANIATWNPASGPQQNDGFGDMMWRVRDMSDDGRSPSVTVTVNGLSAGQDTFAHFHFLSTGNAGEGNAYFTAELVPATGATGFVGDNGTTPPVIVDPPGVPEPTSLAIWCLGMVAAGFGARRMRKQK